MKDHKLQIYTDGAYSSSRNRGGLSAVFVYNDKVLTAYSKGYDNTTNNKMELLAVINAINMSKLKEIEILTDSMYVIGCASMGWKRNKNLEYWELYDRVSKDKFIKFTHVKGHSTNMYNNLADRLAVKASK